MRKPKLTKFGDYAVWVRFPVTANYCVRIIVTDHIANSFEKRLGEGKIDGSTDGCCYHDHKGTTWMFLSPKITAGTVAHESFHVMYELLDYIGSKLENEIVAYHLGYLVDQIENFRNAIKSSTKKRQHGKRKRRASTKKSG